MKFHVNLLHNKYFEIIKTYSLRILGLTKKYSDFEVYEVNGPDIKSMNDFGVTNVKTTKKNDIRANGGNITYSFVPHSFTLIKGMINR